MQHAQGPPQANQRRVATPGFVVGGTASSRRTCKDHGGGDVTITFVTWTE